MIADPFLSVWHTMKDNISARITVLLTIVQEDSAHDCGSLSVCVAQHE